MKVLLLSTLPLGAADIDRLLLTGFSPSAVDVCPTITLALARLDVFTPDLIIVNLPQPDADDAVARLRERGSRVPTMMVAAGETVPAPAGASAYGRHAPDPGDVSSHSGASVHEEDTAQPSPPLEPRITDAALAEARAELDQLGRADVSDALDAETRWLLYEVASVGHVSTSVEGDVLAANDIASRLLRHFSANTAEQPAVMPAPLLAAAGAFAQRPSRFELCLQRGVDEPLHWIVGLASPQGGLPATVTWFLIDVSEQRLQTRRARFLRRMEALTHVLSAATAECSTLVDTGGRALATARERLADDVDVAQAIQALSRTQAVLAQLAGFARRRARRPALTDLCALVEQISSVLVHVTGDEVTWSLQPGDEPLHVSVDAAELEQCLSALAAQGREALPLGGQMRLTLASVLHEHTAEDGRGTRQEVRLTIELQGYGLQPVVTPPALQTHVMRLGAEFAIEEHDHLTTRLVLSLPRVFLTQPV